jgi:hypothetical protein
VTAEAAAAGARVQDPHPLSARHRGDCFHLEFFEFIVLIKEDPFGLKRLPEKFAQYLVKSISHSCSMIIMCKIPQNLL